MVSYFLADNGLQDLGFWATDTTGLPLDMHPKSVLVGFGIRAQVGQKCKKIV
uniref:Uncharacterized protein n=1 Tax=Lepeophtheirus salmonis TaxID=72036 RepID=A0A0K2V9Z9_LEPSM